MKKLKDLKNLKDVKVLDKKEQKAVKGGENAVQQIGGCLGQGCGCDNTDWIIKCVEDANAF
jgi:natural product precursor